MWGRQTLEESAYNNKQKDILSAKGQGFEKVRDRRKSHGWDGRVGGDRGKRRVQ